MNCNIFTLAISIAHIAAFPFHFLFVSYCLKCDILIIKRKIYFLFKLKFSSSYFREYVQKQGFETNLNFGIIARIAIERVLKEIITIWLVIQFSGAGMSKNWIFYIYRIALLHLSSQLLICIKHGMRRNFLFYDFNF